MTLFESPFLLGFEQFERTLNRIAKSAGDGYPPYNIEQLGENGIRITIAVAGFTKDDLEQARRVERAMDQEQKRRERLLDGESAAEPAAPAVRRDAADGGFLPVSAGDHTTR